jgi:hypothetical protein
MPKMSAFSLRMPMRRMACLLTACDPCQRSPHSISYRFGRESDRRLGASVYRLTCGGGYLQICQFCACVAPRFLGEPTALTKAEPLPDAPGLPGQVTRPGHRDHPRDGSEVAADSPAPLCGRVSYMRLSASASDRLPGTPAHESGGPRMARQPAPAIRPLTVGVFVEAVLRSSIVCRPVAGPGGNLSVWDCPEEVGRWGRETDSAR